ncbi:hypothetical protein, partial [Siminovitchia terrae]
EIYRAELDKIWAQIRQGAVDPVQFGESRRYSQFLLFFLFYVNIFNCVHRRKSNIHWECFHDCKV